MSWIAWMKANWKTAAIIVVLLLVAIASATDGYKTRRLLKAAQVNLEEADKAKEKELKEAEKEWLRIVNGADAKLAPVLLERDALRAKLAARSSTPFETPVTDSEIAARWRALGYQVGVGPCR